MTTKIKGIVLVLFIVPISLAFGREYHVAADGSDDSNGSQTEPFKTISFAARQAEAGDIIIVHAGIYREMVSPPKGGASDSKRIIFMAAEGEIVEIRGSEPVKGWKKFSQNVWKIALPNSFFGDYNPYRDEIAGDWFDGKGRVHHTGQVYLNGSALLESGNLQGVLQPDEEMAEQVDPDFFSTWYCESDADHTYIYANFRDYNPNREEVEINVRPSCFYPSKPGVDYITVRGFRMRNAATQWAPPTAEQIALIGTHWSKGWIIENNIISHSKCAGISLGKDRATGQNVWSANRCKDGATHYNEVIFRALEAGWSKENTGGHIVRNNIISNCEQAGIVGSLGAVFSRIYNNHIYDIWKYRMFSGAEIAGIKIHASIDVRITGNHIHHTGRGIWIDWMAQGTRISRNLLHDNTTDDLFSEVNHGPDLVDNNICLSDVALRDWSEGGAFAHNLFAGRFSLRQILNRSTPYHFPHSTGVKGIRNIFGGDNRFYNNLFVKTGKNVESELAGLAGYDKAAQKMYWDSNVFYNGAVPGEIESNALTIRNFDPGISLEETDDGMILTIKLENSMLEWNCGLIDSGRLGRTQVSDLPFKNPDGSDVKIDYDYFGNTRTQGKIVAGPFQEIEAGPNAINVRKY